MMFKILNKIGGVKDFSLYEGNLIYLLESCTIPQLPGLNITDLVTDTRYPGEIFIIKNFLVWQDMYGKALIYDLQGESIVFDNSKKSEIYTFKRIDLVSKGLLVASRRIEGKKELCLFDLIEKEFLPISYNVSNSLNDGSLVLSVSKDSYQVDRINLGGETLWSYAVRETYLNIRQDLIRAGIRNVIGQKHNTLWFGLSSGELIGLDVETGQLKHKIGFNESDLSEFALEVKENNYLPFGELMQLDENKEEIIGLRGKYFIRVSLKQQELKRKYTDVSESMESYQVSSSYRNNTLPYDTRFIYFCDDRQGKIGIFDRNKTQVVWCHELFKATSGISQILEMKYSNKFWYILDRHETLHVFEKES